MAKQVVGLFDNMSDAHQAVQELTNAGFTADDISIVANNANGDYDTTDGSEAAEGAGAGATGGAVAGGLLGLFVGLGALAIPGIGPVVAAGTLATALGSTALGAGIGAAAGGLVGGLVGAGIPEDDANIYAEGVRRGGALVTVQAADDTTADRAADILDRYNVVDIDERGTSYRNSGWNGFDENAGPYNASTSRSSSDAAPSEWEESSKIGTAGGGLAGAATGAAIGSVGGPVGTVIGGVAGALTGAGVGAAGDAAGEAAADATTGEDDYGRSSTVGTSTARGEALGSVTDTTGTTGYTTTGTTGTTGYANTSTTTGTTRDISANEGEIAIPVVEENIRVGTREVESGGVRVTTSVEATPVNEQVTLREEHVTVDRRTVDQPVDASTLTEAFREGTFEVRERDEEAVVAKEARIVEEVVVGKTAEQRTETITDTVRLTNVDVEQITGQTRTVSDTTMTTGTAPTSGYTVADTTTTGGTFGTTGTTGTTGTGDAVQSEWSESSKVGTAGGGLAGAATGAAIGSVGGPIGTVIGGIAGAVTGAGVGAAGDAAGEAAQDAAVGEDDGSMSGRNASAPLGGTSSTRYDDISRIPSDEGAIESGLGNLGAATERATGLDLDNSGGTGDRDRRDNF